MSKLLESVDKRTLLVGRNRLELLMFYLQHGQTFAINVFKIQEVQQIPKITILPEQHPTVVGVTYVRGLTVPVIDLGKAIGMKPIADLKHSTIIITEYNMSVQAFIVKNVDRIVNMDWEDILPPPPSAGRQHYLTSITRIDDRLVEIIDVEKVLSQIVPCKTEVSEGVLEEEVMNLAKDKEILLVDDSSVAISQAKSTLESIGLKVHVAYNGRMGLDILEKWVSEGIDVEEKLLMLVTDAEMPEMDGYRLTAECRANPKLENLFVVLHTSLSGSFNKAMVEKVGCNAFLSKFQPDSLARLVQDRVKMVCGIDVPSTEHKNGVYSA
ncbi:MAG: chemotaxis protein CheW [Gammaproteobacteria bacterium]|nr:MAG: chemotaxis protein CheW [Gammaproteobacteria bacterium]